MKTYDSKYALVGGKPLDTFISETSWKAAEKVDRIDLFEDVRQELWCIALSRPDLVDRDHIRAYHEARAANEPGYAVDDFEVNYSAAKALKLEAQQVARTMAGEGVEQSTEDIWTSKDVARVLKTWDLLPGAVSLALESDRMPEQWRCALERRYRDGESAAAVGKMTLTRARDRLVDILNSGVSCGEGASPEEISREIWGGPSLRPTGFKTTAITWDSESPCEPLEDPDDSGPTHQHSPAAYGALSDVSDDILKTPGEFRKATDDQIIGDLLGVTEEHVSPEIREFFKRCYDVELDLWIWAHTGRYTNAAIEFAVYNLTAEEKHALFVRYNQFRDGKRKRDNFEPGVAALNAVRRSLCIEAGKGSSGKK